MKRLISLNANANDIISSLIIFKKQARNKARFQRKRYDLFACCLQHAKVHPQLLEQNKRENRLRRQSNESWHVALEESQRTELGSMFNNIPDSVELARLCVHCTCFQHIQWLSERSRDGTSDARSREMSCQVVLKITRFEHHFLNLIVEGKLSDCHKDGSRCRGTSAGEQLAKSFLAVDTPESVDCMFVAKNGKIEKVNQC